MPADLNAPQAAQAAIGQYDVRTTPLQMAMVAAGIANQGRVMTPYLIQSVRSANLDIIESTPDPVELSQAVSEQTASTLTKMMVSVVDHGSGARAQIDGVEVAGKTGTAQHDPGKPPHAWFISFAPATDPKVAVAVVVEDGGVTGSEIGGGRVAAPIARARHGGGAEPMTALTTGATLGGRYTLGTAIASGGMGDVWEATDEVLQRPVAVKVMRPQGPEDDAFLERFRDEARGSASLHHPNIASVFDYGEEDGTAYLVMELVPGRTLGEIIRDSDGGMPAEEVRSLLGQAALALSAAHEAGVVHRDVKPANIIVTPEGQAKLTDFGIARVGDGSGHTLTGEVLGTPDYISPEQALGEPATASSDIYSLGVVAHEMITGRKPFDMGTPVATAIAQVNDPPPELPSTVPLDLREVVDACLAKSASDRPADARAVAEAAGVPLGSLPGVTPLPGRAPTPPTVVPAADATRAPSGDPCRTTGRAGPPRPDSFRRSGTRRAPTVMAVGPAEPPRSPGGTSLGLAGRPGRRPRGVGRLRARQRHERRRPRARRPGRRRPRPPPRPPPRRAATTPTADRRAPPGRPPRPPPSPHGDAGHRRHDHDEHQAAARPCRQGQGKGQGEVT